jgi:hypothetical protein
MDRRPELLSSVMLRQNPHNVHEWHKRVKLFEGNPMRQIITFTEAVKTVDVEKVRCCLRSGYRYVKVFKHVQLVMSCRAFCLTPALVQDGSKMDRYAGTGV